MASQYGPVSLRGWGHPYFHVSGVAAATPVSDVPVILWRVVVANSAASAGTVTITDGATTVTALTIPPNDSRAFDFDAELLTSLVITPSAATLDVFVSYS